MLLPTVLPHSSVTVATHGREKGKKKNLDCPSHSSICRGLLSRSSNQKERVGSLWVLACTLCTVLNSGQLWKERERKKRKQKCTPKWVPFSSFGCSLGFTCYCLSFRVRSCFLCFEHSLEIGGSRFTISTPSWQPSSSFPCLPLFPVSLHFPHTSPFFSFHFVLFLCFSFHLGS